MGVNPEDLNFHEDYAIGMEHILDYKERIDVTTPTKKEHLRARGLLDVQVRARKVGYKRNFHNI